MPVDRVLSDPSDVAESEGNIIPVESVAAGAVVGASVTVVPWFTFCWATLDIVDVLTELKVVGIVVLEGVFIDAFAVIELPVFVKGVRTTVLVELVVLIVLVGVTVLLAIERPLLLGKL